MSVELIADAARWDAYVGTAPGATPYHHWVWGKVVQETFGHETYYLAATSNGSIVGVLPLVSIKSRMFGQFLVSMPFSSYGGVLTTDSDAQKALVNEATRLAKDVGARHIEMRQGTACDVEWQDTTAKLTMEVDLPTTADELWKGLSSGMRNKVRNAQKQGLRVEWGKGEMLDGFYRIFSRNMRDLGTPVYPRQWFENLSQRLADMVHLVTVWEGSQAVASGFVLTHRETAEFPWSSALRESRKKYSAVLMYWALLEWAIQNGYRRVDFGRSSPGSGTHEFKKHWGARERPLHWYYWLAPGTPLPGLRADNPRYRWATQLWQHLPLPVANLIGPRIVRAIP